MAGPFESVNASVHNGEHAESKVWHRDGTTESRRGVRYNAIKDTGGIGSHDRALILIARDR